MKRSEKLQETINK